MMSREQNDQLSRVGPGTPMGRLLRRYWAPFLLASEIPEPDCPPVRAKLMGENLVCFPRQQGPHRADRRVLRASRRLALVRPERGMRPALPLSRLEIRRHRAMRRPAVGGGGVGLPQQHQAQVLSVHREGRPDLGLSRPARVAAAAAGAGMDRGRRPAALRLQAPAGMQLPAGDGRRHRFQPRLLAARRRAQHAIRCSRARRATSTTKKTACRCSRSRNLPAAC